MSGFALPANIPAFSIFIPGSIIYIAK